MSTPWNHHSDGYWSRHTCWWTSMMCFVHYGCLNRWTCCSTWTVLAFYVLFTMNASTHGLVVAHGHCCYLYIPDLLYVPDLLQRQQSNHWWTVLYMCRWWQENEFLVWQCDTRWSFPSITNGDARWTIPGVTLKVILWCQKKIWFDISLKCVYVSMYIYVVPVLWTT